MIQVVGGKLKISETLDEAATAEFNNIAVDIMEIINNNVASTCLYQLRDEEKFVTTLNALQHFLKQHRNKLTGTILLIQHVGGICKAGRLKLFAQRQFEFEDCEFQITCKVNKSADDMEKEELRMEDKIDLCKRFIQERQHEPDIKDIIEGFKVGTFYQRLKYMGGVYQEIVDSLKNNVIPR
jgi:hypothetical protein